MEFATTISAGRRFHISATRVTKQCCYVSHGRATLNVCSRSLGLGGCWENRLVGKSSMSVTILKTPIRFIFCRGTVSFGGESLRRCSSRISYLTSSPFESSASRRMLLAIAPRKINWSEKLLYVRCYWQLYIRQGEEGWRPQKRRDPSRLKLGRRMNLHHLWSNKKGYWRWHPCVKSHTCSDSAPGPRNFWRFCQSFLFAWRLPSFAMLGDRVFRTRGRSFAKTTIKHWTNHLALGYTGGCNGWWWKSTADFHSTWN